MYQLCRGTPQSGEFSSFDASLFLAYQDGTLRRGAQIKHDMVMALNRLMLTEYEARHELMPWYLNLKISALATTFQDFTEISDFSSRVPSIIDIFENYLRSVYRGLSFIRVSKEICQHDMSSTLIAEHMCQWWRLPHTDRVNVHSQTEASDFNYLL